MGSSPSCRGRALIWDQPPSGIAPLIAVSSYDFSETGAATVDRRPREQWQIIWGKMATNSVRTSDGSNDSIRFQRMERLTVYLFGATVLFASFGMGEAICYRIILRLDGTTDRIPVEVLSRLVFRLACHCVPSAAFTEIARRGAQRLKLIWARSNQIRGALEGITPWDHTIEKPTVDQSNPRRSG